MMKLKSLNILFVVVLYSITSFSQNKQLKNRNLIAIAPYVPNQIEYISQNSRKNLENKLRKIITSNGYGIGIEYQDRFILTSNITVLNKNIVTGAPPKVALALDVSFHVGDGVTGVKFASTSIEVRGVGKNETKAYNSAIRRIGNKNKEIQQLLNTAKDKIISYFNSNCNNIMKEAENYANISQYEDAIITLSSIPKEVTKCYDLASTKLKTIYKRKIDKECKINITKAQNAWNSGLDFNAAEKAGEYLGDIDPASNCYNEAKRLFGLINKSIENKSTRKWKFEMKKQEEINNYNLRALEVYEKINVERAKNSPTYNVRGWW